MQVLLSMHSRIMYECFELLKPMNGSQTELCGGSDSSSPQHELLARTSMCYAGTKAEKNVSGRRNEVCYGQKKIATERGH